MLSVLVDRTAWGALVYMLLSLATGILYFTWVVTGLALSIGLSILVIGIPVFVGFLASVRLLSRVERALVESLLGRLLQGKAIAAATGIAGECEAKSIPGADIP